MSTSTSERGRRLRFPAISVRTRILVTVLVVTALCMLVTGALFYLVQHERVEARIDRNLDQEVEEFEALAANGVDPATGEPFTTVSDLMRVALQRNVADDNETFLALFAGEPRYFPRGNRPVELEQEPEVLAMLARIPPGSPTIVRDVATSVGTVRLAVVQVSIEGRDDTGTYVMARVVDRELADLDDAVRTFTIVSVVSLVVVGLVGWVVAGRLLRPLRLLRNTAHRISETDLTQRIPVTSNDDVAKLARTFNEMLDRLQSAFETQRQFLDDAGHELRTPVTILRGHTELLDSSDAADVEETRALLLDELDRMSRLVEDLVLLAKARRPDFVQPSEVELGRLTDEVLDKARALGDRTWLVDERSEARVHADPQRLTQALLALAHNAVKFTPPVAVVALGSRADADAGEARLWVRDTGVGIAPEDQRRIFERFGRAETGRGIEGSGLGLAIVSAIADAHGGRVEVGSEPGSGSTFTLVLPYDGGPPPPTVEQPADEPIRTPVERT